MYTLFARQGAGSIGPQILLEELGLPHRVQWLGRADQAQPDYRRLNPTGKIPTLQLEDGSHVFESAAIMIHLVQSHAPNALAPPVGTPAHARFLQWMVFLSANLYEAYLRVYYPARYTRGSATDAEFVKSQALADVLRHVEVAEAALSPFLLGAQPSAADIYLYMLATWHEPSAEALYRQFPRLQAMCEAVARRPAVAKVMAMNA